MKRLSPTSAPAFALAATLMLSAAACSVADPATTIPPTTTTGSPTTTTTFPEEEDFVDRATPIVTDLHVAELEDGLYIGFITAISTEGMTGGPEIQFDLGVWFDGEEADAMAVEDGEESPRPNGYYIRNLDPSHLLLEVSAAVRVSSIWYFYEETELARRSVEFDLVVDAMNPPVGFIGSALRASPWWITITDGRVVSMDEQYVP